MLENQPRSIQNQNENQQSVAQKVFSELRLTGDNSLPTDLFRDRFQYGNTNDLEITSAQRALNWANGWGQSPLVISGASGIGKSVLSWQIMSEADSKGLVSIMVSASDLVMNSNHENYSSGRALPRTPVEKLHETLQKISDLQSSGLKYGSSLVLIIDGIDPNSYNPRLHPEAIQTLKKIQAAECSVILNVDSERALTKGGSLDSYHTLLNPNGRATLGLILTKDSNEKYILTKTDLTFKN